MRALRAVVVTTIVMLVVQGWFGDSVTIFIAPASGITPPPPSPGGIVQELHRLPTPFIPLWHAFEGLALVVLAVVVLILSFAVSMSRGVRDLIYRWVDSELRDTASDKLERFRQAGSAQNQMS